MASALAAIAVPQHKLYESPNSRAIDIFDWNIKVSTNPISNAQDCDTLQSVLGIPLPEMTFGSNYLKIEHRPSSWKYKFSARDALLCVKRGEMESGDGGVKVEYAERWLQSRTNPSSQMEMPKTVPTKAYDWTYTTIYSGHEDKYMDITNKTGVQWLYDDLENPVHDIPMAELTRQDPILFYAEIPLYEDELHDNGSSSLIVRIRVMPTCIFILSRFTLRVDNVLFRTFDTRMYHSFTSSPPLMIREKCGWEAPYNIVKRLLPKHDDLTPLADPAFISKVFVDLPKLLSQSEGAKTGWRGLGTTRSYAMLIST